MLQRCSVLFTTFLLAIPLEFVTPMTRARLELTCVERHRHLKCIRLPMFDRAGRIGR